EVKQIPGVKSATPIVEGQVLVSGGSGVTGALVRGIRQEDLKAQSPLSNKVVLGSLDVFQNDNVAIGIRMAERLGLVQGSKITLTSPRGMQTAFGTIPRVQAFNVGAIYNVGMYEYDNGFVFMPLDTAQKFFGMSTGATTIEMLLDNPYELGPIS